MTGSPREPAVAGYRVVERDRHDAATEIAARLLTVPGPTAVADAVIDIRPVAERRHEL
ncbi:hypothetical protein [Kutzneria sp. NPDC052558]|uniref:hypothetical protein n=1 Tax=Kutzneria sp. NPDC052558 TaxID=3364121 RepID=UPI0037C941BA